MPLEEKLKNWISKEGYPFEMSIAKIFRKKNLIVYESSFYKDHESDKFREIDLLSYYQNTLKESIIFQIKFIVECKYAKNPWVLFSSPDNEFKNSDAHIKVKGNEAANKYLEFISRHPIQENDNKLLSYGADYGYGLIESFKEKDNNSQDLAYKAIDSVF